MLSLVHVDDIVLVSNQSVYFSWMVGKFKESFEIRVSEKIDRLLKIRVEDYDASIKFHSGQWWDTYLIACIWIIANRY